jgi:hypothetical protein
VHDFPLFRLDLVALPHELIPLHIFEERFKTMMNECLRAECEFAIVWLSDDQPARDRLRVRDRPRARADGGWSDEPAGDGHLAVLGARAVGRLAYPAGVIEFSDELAGPHVLRSLTAFRR